MATETVNLASGEYDSLLPLVDIEGAKFRNKDHDCRFNRDLITVAQGYAENPPMVLEKAAEVFLADYDPTTIKAPVRVYYAPHFPGKPGEFTVEFQSSDELFEGWFNQEPVE